ncbi:MAG: type II toxin-antitoxin system HicB family antitoxin [Alphaproteobacteria bacterium]|nr:type II toxin-antitoxin system HicB family antitoxin [Alphaproteobacteria bacterium]
MNTLKYKDYIATISYDPDIDSFMGRVVNARDIVTFYGKSTEDLHKEFKISIEDYLAYCEEEDLEPAKPRYSGQFRLRLPAGLHAKLSAAASAKNVSLNGLVVEILSGQIGIEKLVSFRNPSAMNEIIDSSKSCEDERFKKILFEEYYPLYAFVFSKDENCLAKLMPENNEGPDAVIKLDNKEITAQITTSDISYQTKLTDEMVETRGKEFFDKGKLISTPSEKYRDKKTKTIKQKTDRILESSEAKSNKKADEIMAALKKKIENFHKGTDILIINTNTFLGACSFSWEDRLKNELEKFNDPILYKEVYVIDGCFSEIRETKVIQIHP